MNCPYCGQPMEPGELYARDILDWTPKDRKPPKGLWNTIKYLADPIDNVQVPGEKGWIPAYRIPAHHCPSCRKFIFTGRLESN